VLILARHGRTEANASGLLLGRLDPPLDELGQSQAKAVAAALVGVLAPGSRIVSSPLRRARDTAAAFGLPVAVEDRWVELDYGSFDGRPAGEVGAEVWDRWRVDADFVPAGGESLTAMAARVWQACEDLAEEAAHHDVVVVTHVSPIKAAMAWALGAGVETAWRSHVDPASITRVSVTPRGPVLRSFNEVWHLQEL